MNELIVTRLSDGVSDTLMAAIACVTSEYMYNEIAISQKDTICLDTDELMGAITEVYNICEDQMTDAAEFIIIDGMNCISCLGMEEGNSEACIVVCDEYGICDTTFLFVDVRALDDPTTTKDTLHTQMDRIVIGDILSNDGIPDDLISFEIIRQPDNGNVIVNPDNTVSYEPFEGYCNSFEGGEPDFFMYQICTDGGCTSGVVYVYVDCGKLIFYNGFSPNGDGVNDVFKIEGIGQFPNNKLCVYNRWGNKVYCVDDYQNDWGGTWNTNDLPDGTYFYVFETGEGDRYTGYVQINR
jgi:gliding motility-associated-like protein